MQMKNLALTFLLAAALTGAGCNAPSTKGGESGGDSTEVISTAPLPDSALQPETIAVLEDTVAPDTNAMNDSMVDSGTQTMKGSYLDIQEGDYLHFVMKDEDGKRHSFWLADELPQGEWMPFYDGKHDPGTRIEVEWREVSKFLEAAGAVTPFRNTSPEPN